MTGPGDLERFLRLGEEIYAGNPAWVPPQRDDLIRLLTGRSPLSGLVTHACLFEQGGIPAARAAAFVNDHYVRSHHRRVGFVGLFEARPGHPEAAQAVLMAAGDWLAGRGMEAAVAPINGHVLYGFALPHDHFDELPIFPYGGGLPFYPQAFLDAGYEAAYPELTYLIDLRPLDPSALAARSRAGGIHIRPFGSRSFRDDCETMTQVINDAFAGKWYYAPLPLADSLAFWRRNRQGIVPRLFLIAERDGEPVGALLSFPDYSPALRAMDGSSS
ncbi:MAG: hypothetical protein QN168_15195, partial [Armatimonadota bacterium]|nr:hypothetical protein [Armatimonadota bacterium]